MKRFASVAFLLLSCSVAQVEHAPTAAQCQADQRLWLSEEAEGGKASLPRISVIRVWNREMLQCVEVDPSNEFIYRNTASEIMVEQKMRMESFLDRHQLWNQFIEEDSEGKR